MDSNARLEEIKRQLSPDQLRYLTERVLCRTDAEAARNCGIPVRTVYEWPNETKALLQEAVNLLLSEGVDVSREILRRALTEAARVKVEGLKSKQRMSVRQAAATEILDRFHGKPRQQSDVNVTGGPLTINLTWGDTESDGADRDPAESA